MGITARARVARYSDLLPSLNYLAGSHRAGTEVQIDGGITIAVVDLYLSGTVGTRRYHARVVATAGHIYAHHLA
jgi:hypothetical protein